MNEKLCTCPRCVESGTPVPYGQCHCGCTGEAPIAARTYTKRGIKKGEPYYYIANHGLPKPGRGAKNAQWKGGRRLSSDGYVRIYAPNHPYAMQGTVLEHRLVMEQTLGRYLLPEEQVHHKNGCRTDNRRENLELLPSNSAHVRLHDELDRNGQWAAGYACCSECGSTERKHEAHGLCTSCYGYRYWREQHPDSPQAPRRIDRRYAWSVQWPCCVACGTTERKHNGRGLCQQCYDHWRYQRAGRGD